MIHGNYGNVLQLPDQGDVVFFSEIQNQESTPSKKNVVNMISQKAKTNIYMSQMVQHIHQHCKALCDSETITE